MAFVIRKPEDIIQAKIMKVLIYGPPGVRKTTFAFTAKRVLLLDFQEGVSRVEGKYRGEYVFVGNWSDALDLFSQDLTMFDTIAIDPVGNMLDMISYHIMEKNQKLRRGDGALSLQGYGVLSNQFKEYVTKIEKLGKNIVFIAHDKEVKVKDDVVYRPDITGGSLGFVTREIDLCGYIKSNGGVSTVNFDPSDEYYGKNSCKLGKNLDITKNSLASIIDMGLDFRNANSIQYQFYIEQIKKVSEILDNCQSAEDLNDGYPLIMQMELLPDSLAEAKTLILSKVKQLDLKYNKTSKLYEPKTKTEVQA